MSSKPLIIGVGALGLLALVFASSRAKAAENAAPPEPDDQPQPQPPLALPPGAGAPPASSVLEPPELDAPSSAPAVTSPPELAPPTLDDGGGETMPMQPTSSGGGGAMPMPASSGGGGGATMPMQPVTVAPSGGATSLPSKRPFGDQPLEVTATASNVAPASKVIKPATAPAAKRSAKQAATELLAYVTPILASKRGSELGTKGKPNGAVKAAQLDMDVKPADGIYGPATRARGTALTGKPFPARV